MSEETKEAPEAAAAPAKKGKGAGGIMTIVLVLIIGGASSAAGSVFGPTLAAKVVKQPAGAAAAGGDDHGAPAEKDEAEEIPAELMTLEPLIVDIRDTESGQLHHIRVALAIELKEHPKTEEELKKIAPRARNAVIDFMRSQNYDDVTDPKHFETMRSDLGERVAKAIGQKRCHKVLFTDFVVQ